MPEPKTYTEEEVVTSPTESGHERCRIGNADCHQRSINTGDDPIRNALRAVLSPSSRNSRPQKNP